MHLVLHPVAIELPAICPHITTFTMHVIVLEVSLVHAALAPHEFTMSVFPAILEGASEDRSISPSLNALTILQVVCPVSLICGGLGQGANTITNQSSLAILHVLFVLAFVHCAICVCVLCDTVLFAIFKLALVDSTVRHGQCPLSIEEAVSTLSLIDGAILQLSSDILQNGSVSVLWRACCLIARSAQWRWEASSSCLWQ
mmetsp:Transcript_62946/g.99885  ORF Transcript_62946/g.99885 Transcript_62946/m.99885 type:complete len:200 (-) Transcript_62946:226-825(-)